MLAQRFYFKIMTSLLKNVYFSRYLRVWLKPSHKRQYTLALTLTKNRTGYISERKD